MKKTLQFAFIQTLPVFFGYIFLGIAFGLLLQKAGFNALWALFISTFVYAGSMQFVLISFLSSGISLISVALITLSVNSRHIFYGLSFIEKFKSMGKAYPYMIFSLTDETYSLLCGTTIPAHLDVKKVRFSIALLDQVYWILGSVLGALLGELILFNTTGIDFAMTALFVVIFVEQWLAAKSHFAALLGLSCGVLSLIVFGPSNFILPALIVTVSVLTFHKNAALTKEELS
jgi:4-azaleucine resistance transporter AzlC